MKKWKALVLAGLLGLPLLVSAQVSNNYWVLKPNYIQTLNNNWGLKVPGLATSTTGCLGVNSSGWISANGSACGTGSGGTFPFTITSYNGQTVAATSTGIWDTGSLLGFIASSTFFTNSTTTNSTTTNASFTNASTTNQIVSSLGGSGTSCVQASASGLLSVTGSACGGTGFGYPFTIGNYNGQTVNSTSTGIWDTASPLGLIASSTFATNGTTTNATSTNLDVSNTLTIGTLSGLALTTSGVVTAFGGTNCGANTYTTSINGSGTLTCGQVSLTAGVTGILPILNGGTGTSTNRYGGIFFGDGSLFRQASSTGLLDYDPTTQIFTVKNASSTNLSVLTQAVFGATASSSFSSAGVLTLASALAIGSGGTASSTGGYTNGVYFYDGSSHTNDQAITHQKGANTGIGTTTPTSQLAVSTSTQSANTTPLFTVASTTNDTIITTLGGGQTGIGTTSPFSSLTLGRNGAVASSSILVFGYSPGTSTAMNVDCKDSNTIHVSNGTSALTITLKPMLFGQTCSVIVSNSGGTPGTVAWTAAANQPIYWNAGTAPTQTTTAYKRDVYSFKADLMSASATTTPGVSILGMQAQNF